MTTRTALSSSVTQRYEPLDLLLGPADERYFGSGYREVKYTAVGGLLGGRLEGAGVVVYPQGWSVGAGRQRRTPHLSSIDAVVLSLILLEKCSASHELSDLFVASIELRAGARPWEKLDAVPLQLDVESTRATLEVCGLVGNIHVRITLALRENPTDVATDGESVYGVLFQTTRSESVVCNGAQDGSFVGRHQVIVDSSRKPHGIEAFAWPGPTVLDYLVLLGQMTQALVYTSAGLSRSTAGPLWMRTMRVERSAPPEGGSESEFGSNAQIARDRLLIRSGTRVHDVKVNATTTTGVRAMSTLAYVEAEAG